MAAQPLRTAEQLLEAGLIAAADLETVRAVTGTYPAALPEALVALIDREDPNDPIARQIVPSALERTIAPEELADPTGDGAHSPVPGVVHRHGDRALLKVVQVCPLYCRFCFRRETVGAGALSPAELDAALAYIAGRPEIWEVILTGGDPFMLPAAKARALTQRLAAIAHVRVIRWHTRMPVADPGRVDAAYAEALAAPGKAVYVAVHANHPRELSQAARAACRRLIGAGATLVSQTVLLKGVNDDLETLSALMRGFVETGVKPYYLHHPDLAPGTGHFRVGLEEGRALAQALRDTLSGLCQPTYVLDIPGGVSKALSAASEVEGSAVRGRDGVWRPYPPAAAPG